MLGTTSNAGFQLRGSETPRKPQTLPKLDPGVVAFTAAYMQLGPAPKALVDSGSVEWASDAQGWVWVDSRDEVELPEFDLIAMRWDGVKRPASKDKAKPDTWPAKPLTTSTGSSEDGKLGKEVGEGLPQCSYTAEDMPEYLKSLAKALTGGGAVTAPVALVMPAVEYLVGGPRKLRQVAEAPADVVLTKDATKAANTLTTEMQTYLLRWYNDRHCLGLTDKPEERAELDAKVDAVATSKYGDLYDVKFARALALFDYLTEVVMEQAESGDSGFFQKTDAVYTLAPTACVEIFGVEPDGTTMNACSVPQIELRSDAAGLGQILKAVVDRAAEFATEAGGLNMEAASKAKTEMGGTALKVAAVGGGALLLYHLLRK